MKIQYPAGVTRDYLNRNPIFKNFSGVQASNPPHASYDWFSYTVPVARIFRLEYAFVRLVRETAAGTPGPAIITMPTNRMVYAFVISNGVGDHSENGGYMGAWFPAGTVIKIQSYDLSTGGTFNLHYVVAGVEFDAS